MSLSRPHSISAINAALKHNPVVALLGPRQCGKTTLARLIQQQAAEKKQQCSFFDLENSTDIQRLSNPLLALEDLKGLVIIDEAQLKPEIFPTLRVLADRKPLKARFLILGSSNPDLMQGSAETLAGRIAFINLAGFDLGEVGAQNWKKLWLRGGFPKSYLAAGEAQSLNWRENFTRTFLETDLRKFGVQVQPQAMSRLWQMLAHYHGNVANSSEIGRSLGESHPTIKRHIDILTNALVVRQLQPWHENLGKRQVKSPKIYIRDSGLLHSLLGIGNFSGLSGHPKLGASFEGFVLDLIIRAAGGQHCYFWATQSEAELDLMVIKNGKRYGFEVKYTDSPAISKSMRIALHDLGLEKISVIYPGSGSNFPLDSKIEAVPVTNLINALPK